MDADLQICGDAQKGRAFADSLGSCSFLFSMVMSYTATCEIPGITIAGADSDSFKFTPPADAEYLHYGYCKTIDGIPMTPDGKPTPALLTKVALESSSIPHIVVNAGSRILPRLPFVEAGLPSGNNICLCDAMTMQAVAHAVDYGRIVGRSLAPLADCLVIGESIPAGTTTAMAVLSGLGFPARVSSSMPENPTRLKEDVVRTALSRGMIGQQQQQQHTGCGQKGNINGGDLLCDDDVPRGTQYAHDVSDKGPSSNHDDGGGGVLGLSGTGHTSTFSGHAEKQQYLYKVVSKVGDPMVPFVAGMLSSASVSSKVMLAGGTQMAAVLAFASGIGFDSNNVAVGTTTYVVNDRSADFAQMMSRAGVPALAVDPGLDGSRHAGLRAFAGGYAQEGVGAGGCMISAMLKSGLKRADIVRAADAEYDRLSFSVT